MSVAGGVSTEKTESKLSGFGILLVELSRPRPSLVSFHFPPSDHLYLPLAPRNQSFIPQSVPISYDCRCFNTVVNFIKSFLLVNLVNKPKFFTFHPDLKTLNCFNVMPYDQEIINKPKSKLKDEVPHFSTNLQITNIVMPFKL